MRRDHREIHLSLGSSATYDSQEVGFLEVMGRFSEAKLATQADVYPLLNMLNFSDRLSGCKVFSKIDLRKGYW